MSTKSRYRAQVPNAREMVHQLDDVARLINFGLLKHGSVAEPLELGLYGYDPKERIASVDAFKIQELERRVAPANQSVVGGPFLTTILTFMSTIRF